MRVKDQHLIESSSDDLEKEELFGAFLVLAALGVAVVMGSLRLALVVLLIVTCVPSFGHAFRNIFKRLRRRSNVKKDDQDSRRSKKVDTPTKTRSSPFSEETSSTTTSSSSSSSYASALLNPITSWRASAVQVLNDLWHDYGSPFTFRDEMWDEVWKEEDPYTPDFAADVTHFCFLVHGYRGTSRDLGYLRKRLLHAAQQEKQEKQGQPDSAKVRHDVVVHATASNEGRTDDGLVAGGDRLVEEFRTVVQQEMAKRTNSEESSCMPRITISVVGNSLGGLYIRYAIAMLLARCCELNGDGELILDGQYRLEFNIFCTTASPHMGLKGHTFLPIPRTAEIGLAHVLGATGKDIFRLNDLLEQMATSDRYLRALSLFRHRIAYANAYATDFPVTTNTAAFLNEGSDYPHFFVDENGESLEQEESGFGVATLRTRPKRSSSDSNVKRRTTNENVDQLMSRSLDELGWTKVIIDSRKSMPKLPLLGSFRNRANSIRQSFPSLGIPGGGSDDSMESDESDHESVDGEQVDRNEAIERLRDQDVAPSREIAQALTAPLFDEQFHWPLGHDMMVAVSRSRLSMYMNRAGRPIMDALARRLVGDIFAWEPNEGGK